MEEKGGVQGPKKWRGGHECGALRREMECLKGPSEGEAELGFLL